MSLVDVIIEDPRWQVLGLEALAERAGHAALAHLGLRPGRFEVGLLGCDDARIAVLNQDFLGKPAATNVLSWPSVERASQVAGAAPDPPKGAPGGVEELGDVAIAYETCAREAAVAGLVFEDHVTHLLVHGILHLLGYDHMSEKDAALMEGLEVEILASLGIADPY